MAFASEYTELLHAEAAITAANALQAENIESFARLKVCYIARQLYSFMSDICESLDDVVICDPRMSESLAHDLYLLHEYVIICCVYQQDVLISEKSYKLGERASDCQPA